MSKLRKFSAPVIALALVLCIGYFAVMSPTSAWFYESGVVDSGNTFIFGDVSADTAFVANDNVTFDGATKFADKNEVMFDDVINIDEISATNSGTVPSRIYANVVNKGTAKGLKWFAYSDQEVVEGSVKKTIESVLPALTEKALNTYNVGADGNSGHYILLQPGESTVINVATWIEYDYVSNSISNGSKLGGYNVEITLIASQDVDGAINR